MTSVSITFFRIISKAKEIFFPTQEEKSTEVRNIHTELGH